MEAIIAVVELEVLIDQRYSFSQGVAQVPHMLSQHFLPTIWSSSLDLLDRYAYLYHSFCSNLAVQLKTGLGPLAKQELTRQKLIEPRFCPSWLDQAQVVDLQPPTLVLHMHPQSPNQTDSVPSKIGRSDLMELLIQLQHLWLSHMATTWFLRYDMSLLRVSFSNF